MESEGFKRKLSAILSADVVGNSGLISEDNDAMVRTLTGHREISQVHVNQFFSYPDRNKPFMIIENNNDLYYNL